MIYFAWINASEQFHATQHAREDLKIFNLSITHTEGNYATAEVTVAPDWNNYREKIESNQHYAFISIQNHLRHVIPLFKGVVSIIPKKNDDDFIVLLFKAMPLNAMQIWQEWHHRRKETVPYHHLFFSKTTYLDTLLADPVQPFWHPVTHHLSASNIFWGNKKNVLRHGILDGSFHMHCLKPLQRVHVTLSAQWSQTTFETLNLTQRLRRMFPEGSVNTYAGASFKRAWPRKGQKLSNGCRVLYSSLKEKSAPQLHNTFLGPFHFNHQGVQHKVIVKRTWFDAELIVQWKMRQKRVEHLNFTMESDLYSFPIENSHHQPLEQNITFNLGQITRAPSHPFWMPKTHYEVQQIVYHSNALWKCVQSHDSHTLFQKNVNNWEKIENDDAHKHKDMPAHQASFFTTHLGYETFEYAVERARTMLAFGARALRIRWKMALHQWPDITLDDNVQIYDARVPHGNIIGKVIQYNIHIDASSGARTLEVQIACSIGIESKAHGSAPSSSHIANEEKYAVDNVFEHNVIAYPNQLRTTRNNIQFEAFDAQTPRDDLAQPHALNPHMRFQGISIENAPTLQAELIQNTLQNNTSLNQNDLQNIKTRIHIQMKPLNIKPCQKHCIKLQKTLHWTPPKHIDVDNALNE